MRRGPKAIGAAHLLGQGLAPAISSVTSSVGPASQPIAHGRRGEADAGDAVREHKGLMQDRLASRLSVVAAAYAEGRLGPSLSRSCVKAFSLPGVEWPDRNDKSAVEAEGGRRRAAKSAKGAYRLRVRRRNGEVWDTEGDASARPFNSTQECLPDRPPTPSSFPRVGAEPHKAPR